MSIRSLWTKARQKSGFIWLVAGGAGFSVAVGCSSDFSSCEDSKTCTGAGGSAGTAGSPQAGAPDDTVPNASTGGTGAGGSGMGAGGSADAGARPVSDAAGAAGAAGEANAPPKPECVVAADCDDHLACNGVESCDMGVCKPGTAPCANPDAAHCDVICTEAGGAASCLVQGQDKDHDTYLSKLCLSSAKPATDCDDNVATTHPGAPELCDRVDNNCNGLIDLSDGLLVSGKSDPIGAATSSTRATPAIAWATDKAVYGLVWYDETTGTNGDVFFETFNTAGVTQVAAEEINAQKGTSSTAGLGLTFGGDSFGLAWITGGAKDTYFTTVSSAGAVKLSQVVVGDLDFSSGPKVARVPNGAWAVVWSAFTGGGTPNNLWGNTITAAGMTGTEATIGTGTGAGIASTGTKFVVVSDVTGVAKGETLSPALATPAPITLTGKQPVVGSGPNGYAVAVAGAAFPSFYNFGPTGTLLCSSGFADANFAPAAIVSTPTGYLVVSSGALRAIEVSADCKQGEFFAIDPGPAANVSIAGSAAGYAVVWQDTTAGVPKRHLFGPNFCN
jgi:hypothetical protein